MFYEVLESNLLDFFVIKSFILKRRRIENDNNVDNYMTDDADYKVSQVSESFGTTAEFTDTPDVFTEFGFKGDTVSFELGKQSEASFTRDQAMAYATPENIGPELVGQFIDMFEEFESGFLSLIRQEYTPSALSEVQTGRKSSTDMIVEETISLNGVYNAEEYKIGLSFGEPSEINVIDDNIGLVDLDQVAYAEPGIVSTPEVDQYIVNNIGNMDIGTMGDIASMVSTGNLGQVAMTQLAQDDGFDFEFQVPDPFFEEGIIGDTIDKDSDQVESLDMEDQQYTIDIENSNTQQAIAENSTQNLFQSLSEPAAPAPEIELEWLSGYETDDYGRSMMMAPIFSPISEITEEDQGSEFLFRARSPENTNVLPTYNEYFVKRV